MFDFVLQFRFAGLQPVKPPGKFALGRIFNWPTVLHDASNEASPMPKADHPQLIIFLVPDAQKSSFLSTFWPATRQAPTPPPQGGIACQASTSDDAGRCWV
eukprot:EG_transcript_25268